jgi:hypothetical protein
MNKITNQEKELIKRINEVLFYVWDPVGVYTEPEARDEYDSYVPQVFSLLKQSNPSENLKKYLFDIAKKEIASEITEDNLKKVVELLINWKEVLLNKNL